MKTITIEDSKAIMATAEALKKGFEANPNATVRKLANNCGIKNYMGLLNASRKPVVGMTYDPDAMNYDAMAKVLLRNKVDAATINWEEVAAETQRATGTVIKDLDAFEVGAKVYLRREPTTPYTIVYKTETHIVLLLEGSTEPLAWKNTTFLFNGPQFTPREAKPADSAEAATSEEVDG